MYSDGNVFFLTYVTYEPTIGSSGPVQPINAQMWSTVSYIHSRHKQQ